MGRPDILTPEDIAPWLIDQQCTFFDALNRALRSPREDGTPSVKPSEDALTSLTCNALQVQLAFLAFVFEPHLDDSHLFQTGQKQDIQLDLLGFVNRIHERARDILKPQWKDVFESEVIDIDTGIDMYATAPFAIDFSHLEQNFLLYYGAFFLDLSLYAKGAPDATDFALAMVSQMKTESPIVKPIPLAYYFAHEQIWNDDEELFTRVMSRTYRVWGMWLAESVARIRKFVRNRSLSA